jgi:hypothetical protein
LDNLCDPDFDGIAFINAEYQFTVPGAVRYGSVRASTYGFTLQPPSEILSVYYKTSSDLDVRIATVNSQNGNWYSFGSVSAVGRVSSQHQVDIAIGVDNSYNSGGFESDFDLREVRLFISYYVLN